MWKHLSKIVALYYAAVVDELTIQQQLAQYLRAAIEEDRAQFVQRFGQDLVEELEDSAAE